MALMELLLGDLRHLQRHADALRRVNQVIRNGAAVGR